MKHRPTACAVALAAGLCAASALAGDEAQKPAPAPSKSDRLKQVHTLFARHDQNKDGTLVGKELPKNWLAAFDLDGDGKLTRSEFTEIQMRPPKLRRMHYMRDALARARRTLAQFDADKDGLVQRKEFPGSDRQFGQADRNNDDALSDRELLKQAAAELKDIRRRMKRPNRREFLDFHDIDGNRNVTKDEFDGSMRAFNRFDTNNDGEVGYYELYPEYAERDRRTAENYEPKPEKLNVVESMDTDGDKRVSRAEWKGTDAAWKRLDRNRDGYISRGDAN